MPRLQAWPGGAGDRAGLHTYFRAAPTPRKIRSKFQGDMSVYMKNFANEDEIAYPE